MNNKKFKNLKYKEQLVCSKDNTVLPTDVQQGEVQIFIYLRKPGSIMSILIF